MTSPNRPDRKLVLRIVTEEADRAAVEIADVLGGKGSADAREARSRAMCRIVRESGCDASGLARVWGCDRVTVSQYAREVLERGPTPVDDGTRARLHWQYGDRARAIIAGREPATLQDLARWRALGRRVQP